MATQGDIVAAGAVAIRIAQMTGWVSFTLMADLYANIGEVEDGINTLTPRNRVEDDPGAQPHASAARPDPKCVIWALPMAGTLAGFGTST